MLRHILLPWLIGCLLAASSTGVATICQAQDQTTNVEANKRNAKNHAKDREALYQKFSETLSGSKLVGNFTIVGQEKKDLTPEEYHIKSVKKMDKGNLWMFKARIKYGGKDVTVPLPLEVQWAGDTPVVTLTDINIPMMGTFSARVVFYNNKYAGTWSHGDVGGHLFGTIVPNAAEDGEDSPKTDDNSKGKSPNADDGRK